jgi:hypothetical protein
MYALHCTHVLLRTNIFVFAGPLQYLVHRHVQKIIHAHIHIHTHIRMACTTCKQTQRETQANMDAYTRTHTHVNIDTCIHTCTNTYLDDGRCWILRVLLWRCSQGEGPWSCTRPCRLPPDKHGCKENKQILLSNIPSGWSFNDVYARRKFRTDMVFTSLA